MPLNRSSMTEKQSRGSWKVPVRLLSDLALAFHLSLLLDEAFFYVSSFQLEGHPHRHGSPRPSHPA
jgi:hypothetical protein